MIPLAALSLVKTSLRSKRTIPPGGRTIVTGTVAVRPDRPCGILASVHGDENRGSLSPRVTGRHVPLCTCQEPPRPNQHWQQRINSDSACQIPLLPWSRYQTGVSASVLDGRHSDSAMSSDMVVAFTSKPPLLPWMAAHSNLLF